MSIQQNMHPLLAELYHRRLPFCRDAVRATVADYSAAQPVQDLFDLCEQDYLPGSLDRGLTKPLLSYVDRGGKLLRPFVVCCCLEAYGHDPVLHPLPVAMAELIHSASLMLDDVADDSILRRGMPSAHQSLGVIVASATGTAWINLCSMIVWRHRAQLSDGIAQQILERILWAHTATGFGQTIDVGWAWLRPARPLDRAYLQGVILRNAYTYRLAFEIGGLAAGAPAKDVVHLGAFGERIGLAYQIIDDLLNLRPRDANWGKVFAEDITDGKYSLPIILGLESAAAPQRERLREILRSRTAQRDLLLEAIAILDESGAFAKSDPIAQQIVTQSKEHLAALRIPEAHRATLNAFADFLVRRGM